MFKSDLVCSFYRFDTPRNRGSITEKVTSKERSFDTYCQHDTNSSTSLAIVVILVPIAVCELYNWIYCNYFHGLVFMPIQCHFKLMSEELLMKVSSNPAWCLVLKGPLRVEMFSRDSNRFLFKSFSQTLNSYSIQN